jgi:hypothetical protein
VSSGGLNPKRHRTNRPKGRQAGRKGFRVQALNHSSLNFNSFALRRPFCGRIKLICKDGGWALPGERLWDSGFVATARPAGMCCVMACAAWSFSDGWRDAGAGPADAGARSRRCGARPSRSRETAIFEPVSGRYDRFATGFATLAAGTMPRRLSYGIGAGFPAIVIVGMVNPGMVDSGAAAAGARSPAKWGRSAGSGALLNRSSG